ncbi:hypothetical protein D6D17_09715 [Aureobasidium pullulans]|uniref:Uncharacterized protein n=1 Tax=Aureobasidium pullulans EXF-150 TaxID=1043002 RepID=A0A074XWV3_AURPU|nr:uncharacterized protein M438DRAFT_409729 [Aureobasidium pullulans EXF-150]KEQ79111.1 hypothetical protein M438DRAFT_409729 [Aureobasidium pullulans EXF-150]THW02876.1 hypothetical protein D6D26_03934 [Aureobasidium pullulans]THW81265.1 hypothetical protein D6D17_09715 [Aureobasidium pullulans]THY96217.1 hypothetical protein D6C92_04023 [Aureobasidium pullulans]
MPWGTFSRSRVQRDLGDFGEPSEDDQSLGQRRGNIDVRCTFKAEEFKWAADDQISKTLALLYFEFDILRGNARFELATVEIDVGTPCDETISSITLKDFAPRNGITGLSQDVLIEERHQTDPEINAGALGTSLGLRGHLNERNTSTTERRRWVFKAGTPSTEQNIPRVAEFRWESNGDHSDASRRRVGALTLKCTGLPPVQTAQGSGDTPRPDPLASGDLQGSDRPLSKISPSPEQPVPQEPPRSISTPKKSLKLKVTVTVYPCRWWQQLGHSGPKSKESNRIPLLDERKTTSEDFKTQEKQLQRTIEQDNADMAPAQVPETRAIPTTDVSRNPMPHRNRDVTKAQAS